MKNIFISAFTSLFILSSCGGGSGSDSSNSNVSVSGQLDSDNDGVADSADAFPQDASETADSDQDGVGDNSDAFPQDASESADSDLDGVGDNSDAFPQDASETADSDQDGVGDNSDAFPLDASETADLDNDGIGDNADNYPSDPLNGEALIVCPRDQPVGTKDYQCVTKSFLDYGVGSIHDFTVTNSDILTFDREQRKSELNSYASDLVENICTTDNSVDYSMVIDPVVSNYSRELEQANILDMRRDFAEAAAKWQGNDDSIAGRYIVDNLLAWASAQSLTDIDFTNGGDTYDLKRWSIAALLAWDAVEEADFITQTEKSIIEVYLDSVISSVNYYDYIANGSDNPSGLDIYNHGWFRDTINMLWGVNTDSDELFQLGVKRYLRILDAHLREDGSIVAETQRGSVALHYNGNSLGHLVMIAEIAINQGYDLYSVEVNGVDIHKAVEYMLLAMQDHSLVTQYSQYQLTCTEEQCANWATQDFNESPGWSDVAWVEMYIRRFPDSAVSEQLRDYFPLPEFSVQYHGTLGSSVSCDYTKY